MKTKFLAQIETVKMWLRSLQAVVLLSSCFAGIGLSVTVPVMAEPTVTDSVVSYCLTVVPSKLRSSCASISKTARQGGSWQCKDTSTANNEKYKCITNNARGYIKQAAKKLKKSAKAKAYTDEICRLAKKDGGHCDKFSPDSQQSSTPSSTCANGKCVDPAADPSADCVANGCDIIDKYINPAINLLSVSFGVIAAMSIILGGIQYQMSAGDSQKVTQAKKRIINSLVAIIAYFFLFGFLQFLIPGGLFR